MPEFINVANSSKVGMLLNGSLLIESQEVAVAASFQLFLIETGRF